jgi:hypothetical protein
MGLCLSFGPSGTWHYLGVPLDEPCFDFFFDTTFSPGSMGLSVDGHLLPQLCRH